MNVTHLMKFRKGKLLKKTFHRLFLSAGLDLPATVECGSNVQFPHNSIGTVIHDRTIIGNNVKIYQNVTIGRQDIWNDKCNLEKIIIEDGAIICAGAKIIGKTGILKIGKNSIVGANCVLTHSIGDNEIWAGIPAKKIRKIQ